MAQHIVSHAGSRLPFPQYQRKVETISMIQSIIKRDGRVVLYDQNKIAAAILRALEASHEGDAADAARIRDAIADGCGTDAPGSLVAWMCKHSVLHSMEMPGSRYDIGNLESYENVQKTYHGITR